jgi:glycerol-3-phosphate acyltransferase PlsY
VLISRYVSLGSIISVVGYAAAVGLTEYFLRDNPAWYIGVIFCSSIAVILIFKHKDNIKRLIAGNEKKLGKKHG